MEKPALRVAVIQNETELSGGAFSVERYLIDLLKSVSNELNIQVEVIQSNESKSKIIRHLSNYFFEKMLNNKIMNQLLMKYPTVVSSRIERRLKRNEIQLVFFFGTYHESQKLLRTPYVICIWDLGHRDLIGFPETYQNGIFETRERNIRTLGMRSFHILTDSEETAQRITTNFGIEKSRVSSLTLFPHEGPLLNVKKVNEDLLSESKYLIYPANFWTHKNHVTLIEAMKHNKEQDIESFKLIFTGHDMGNKKYLDNLIKHYGLSDDIKIYDFVTRRELLNLYQQSEGMVYPSLLGPTNIPPLEALLLGIPVFVAENAASNLRNFNGINFLEPFDIGAWAKALAISKMSKNKTTQSNYGRILRMHKDNKDTVIKILKNMLPRQRVWQKDLKRVDSELN
jgi:glycosyltransferase involved in cell wall biosynthesis